MATMSREMRQALMDFNSALTAAEEIQNSNAASADQLDASTERLMSAKKALKSQAAADHFNLAFDVNGNVIEGKDGDNSQSAYSGGQILNNHGGNTMTTSSIKSYTKANSAELVKDFASKKEDEQGLHIGSYLRGALTGNWEGAEKERSAFRSLATAGGTILIPQELSAQILAQVMNKSLLYGTVPILPMTSDSLTIAKVTSGPQVGFAAEGALAPGMSFDSTKGTYSAADMAFEGVQFKSKTVRGVAKISNELLSSAANLDQAVIEAFSSGLADAIDKASIYSDGTNNTIKGITATAGINAIAKGADNNYIPFVKAIGAIRAANGEPTTWGLNAASDTVLNSLLDANNNPLKVPDVVTGLTRSISNNLRNNLAVDGTTTGTGDKTFSESLVFDPKAMAFGQQMSVQFTVTNVGMDAVGTNSTYIAVASYIDFAVLRPAFISRVFGI